MTWSTAQFDFYFPEELLQSVITHWMLSGLLIGVCVIALLYIPTHRWLMITFSSYRELAQDQKTVVITHTVEAVILSLLFIPFTYLILSIHFEVQPPEDFRKKTATIATIMCVIVIMFMIELALRFSKPRPLVVIHHLLAYANAVFPAIALTTANMRAASLLVYFITFEALTFVGLVMYRLCPTHKATRPIIKAGMLVFGLSRPVQLAWIIAGMVAVWDVVIVWQAVVQIVLATLFTTLQIYSLLIHYKMYQKCERLEEVKDDTDETYDIDDDDKEVSEGPWDNVDIEVALSALELSEVTA